MMMMMLMNKKKNNLRIYEPPLIMVYEKSYTAKDNFGKTNFNLKPKHLSGNLKES